MDPAYSPTTCPWALTCFTLTPAPATIYVERDQYGDRAIPVPAGVYASDYDGGAKVDAFAPISDIGFGQALYAGIVAARVKAGQPAQPGAGVTAPPVPWTPDHTDWPLWPPDHQSHCTALCRPSEPVQPSNVPLGGTAIMLATALILLTTVKRWRTI